MSREALSFGLFAQFAVLYALAFWAEPLNAVSNAAFLYTFASVPRTLSLTNVTTTPAELTIPSGESLTLVNSNFTAPVTNTGTQTWSATGTNRFLLGIHFGTASDGWAVGWATDQRFSLPADVAAGASVTFSVSVTAPGGAGSYVLRHRMAQQGVTWFGQIQKTNVTVAGQPPLAASYSASPPTAWTGASCSSSATPGRCCSRRCSPC